MTIAVFVALVSIAISVVDGEHPFAVSLGRVAACLSDARALLVNALIIFARLTAKKKLTKCSCAVVVCCYQR